MKLVNIPGQRYLNFYEDYSDYAFCLAHLVIQDEAYAKWFREYNGPTIIDNGAAELGKSIDIKKFVEIVRDIRGDKKFFEVWCPDDLYDMQKSLDMTREFIDLLTDEEQRNLSLVGIPQGKTHAEWMNAYRELTSDLAIKVIALSKYSVPQCFKEVTGTDDLATNRRECVRQLIAMKTTIPLHFAGADNNILKEIYFGKLNPIVRSIDSNIAFKMGIGALDVRFDNEPKARLNHDVIIDNVKGYFVKHNMMILLEARGFK